MKNFLKINNLMEENNLLFFKAMVCEKIERYDEVIQNLNSLVGLNVNEKENVEEKMV